MKRRAFLKSFGAIGVSASVPAIFGSQSWIRSASAAPAFNEVNFVLPSVLPQVINVFLYGGPSELAGNLTNIEAINANSQTAYPNNLLMSQSVGGLITNNGFWSLAGGNAMEDMLASGDMSIYRTINRRKNNTRAHRPSVFSSQKGSLDIEVAPGMGSTLAAALYANRDKIDGSSLLGGRQLTALALPFVSFEGTTTAFAPDPDSRLPLQLKGLSLDQNFDNPYSRGSNDHDVELQALVNKVVGQAQRTRFSQVAEGFELRRTMEALVGNLIDASNKPLPIIPGADPNIDPDVDINGVLQYPVGNRYSGRLKAAVTLAIENPDSLYITVGGGLGGWDDHNSAIERYEPRMNDLMIALRVAMKHIRYSDTSLGGLRRTDNIVINVHGDFGRNVNLNNSEGWDHGNNQNLYTFGGAAVRRGGQSALGKVVGKTELFGPSKQNRQFTRPTSDSYETEPMSIASTLYSYFGVQNPEVLTKDADMNPTGDTAINETLSGEPPMFS